MSIPEIKYGNREGQYFTEWRFELLAELLQLFHTGPMPPHSMVLEVVDPEIWYDAHEDFHRLKFTSHGHVVEVQFYKVYSSKIDGVEGWVGCPRGQIYDYANSLRRKVVSYDMALALAEAEPESNQYFAVYARHAKRLAALHNVDAAALFDKLNNQTYHSSVEQLESLDADAVNKLLAGKSK